MADSAFSENEQFALQADKDNPNQCFIQSLTPSLEDTKYQTSIPNNTKHIHGIEWISQGTERWYPWYAQLGPKNLGLAENHPAKNRARTTK